MARTSRRLLASPALLAAAVWFGAVWFYCGAIGKSRDDWTWTLIDPVTGRAAWGELLDLPLFWRPLSLILMRALNTVLWEADWLANTLVALAHGVVGWAVWRLALGAGAGPRAAGLAALAFVAFPLTFDVALWATAMPTALATALLFAVAGLTLRWRQRSLNPRRAVALVVMAAAIPCLNEQPAAALPGVAVLAWIVGQRGGRFRRAGAIAALTLPPQALYLALFRATADPSFRGGTGTSTASADYGDRALYALRGVWEWTLGPPGRALLADAVGLGLETLSSAAGIAWGLAMLLGITAWIRWRPAAREDAAEDRKRRLLGVAAFGVLGAACTAGPVILIRTVWIEPRLFYPGSALLAVVGACGASAVARAAPPARAPAVAAQAIVIAAITAGAVAMIGIQKLQRTRDRFDRQEVAQLAALAPDPPPGAVFLAMRVDRSAAAGYPGLTRIEHGAWSFEHIGVAQLRFAFGRRDIYSNRTDRGTPVEITDDGVIMAPWEQPAWAGPRAPRQLIRWRRVYPFIVEADGQVLPSTRDGKPIVP